MLVLAATATGAFTRAGLASTSREDHLRAEIAQLLNGERAFRGLGQLPVDASLSRSAQAWAERNQSVKCQPPGDCHSPDAEAEILAWGGPNSKTGEIVVAWMHSAVHRDILLHPKATTMGVGFVCSSDGTVYTAVQFAGPRQPVPVTTETPIASATTQGSACNGPAAPLSQTAPPSTTTSTSPPPAPPTTAAPGPAVAPRVPAPVTPATLPAPVAPTTAVPPPTTAPTTTTTFLTSVVLSAESPSVTANADAAAAEFASAPLAPPHKAESAWIVLVVVIVFLSVLRVGFQLRDNADTRLKERANALGL
jgi:hypothetical protein